MKVFAEFLEENGKTYRKKTLLQFGDSTDLIGSAVLMNPGSATYRSEPCDINVIKEFYLKEHGMSISDSWFNCTADPTMKFLEKIFNGSYTTGQSKELKGIVQLFNCFYYRDANLENAIANFNSDDSKYIFNEQELFLDKPVYFGWGNVGKYGVLQKIASRIFNDYDKSQTPIYNENFNQNCFYHPGYVNRSYSRNPKTKTITQEFFKLIQ